MAKQRFFNLTLDELTHSLKALGKQGFRGQQLFRWIYSLNTQDFDKMTNLSKDFRKEVPELFDFSLPPILQRHVSVDGTTKFLFDMGGGKSVEAVIIPSRG